LFCIRFISVEYRGDRGEERAMSGWSPEEMNFGCEGCTPGVLQKSAEALDGKRVGEMLFFEECGRI
jgi:hypothetical protein